MGVFSGIVLFLVIWFMTLLVVLPIRIETQADAGRVVPGTHAGAPERHHLKRKLWIASGVSVVLFAVIATIILSGAVSMRDIDMFNRMGPAGEAPS